MTIIRDSLHLSALFPWTLRDFAVKRPKLYNVAPDASAKARCLLCGKLLRKGQPYRAPSSPARTQGKVVHEDCFLRELLKATYRRRAPVAESQGKRQYAARSRAR
jgi:hypothetical protein